MRKLKKLKDILNDLERVVVAYSGGLDSTFLLKVALDALGNGNVMAVTARSETYPYSEYRDARNMAKKFGAKHLTINTRELGIEDFRSNPENRCYFCKKELFGRLDAIKDRYGMKHVIDGTNSDDLKDVRPGSKAAKELGVRKPLLEAGLTKDEIRELSKKLKLPTWNKPSLACLASRIPFNNAITKNKLKKIELAEEYLREIGFAQVRVRLHDTIARIEVSEGDLALGMKFKDSIITKLKQLGFVYIALDLEGYRTGSMHESAEAH